MSLLVRSAPVRSHPHVQVVVVVGELLDDAPRAGEAGVRPDEDARGARAREEVDERLREPAVDLARPLRRTLESVQPRVVDVDVEAVLVRNMAGEAQARTEIAA